MPAPSWVRQPIVRAPLERTEAIVRADLAARGWRILRWPLRLSMAFAPLRLVLLGRRADVWTLVHEHVHTRQFGGGFWAGLGRTLCYLLSRRVRLACEVEARAHAAVAMVARGLDGTPESYGRALAFALVVLPPGTLAGWRWPYLTGARAEQVTKATEARIVELLAEAWRGLVGPGPASAVVTTP